MSDLDVKQTARYTHLSPKTIYNLVYQKKIPFHRLSEKKVIFKKEEIDKWLKDRQDDGDSSTKKEIKSIQAILGPKKTTLFIIALILGSGMLFFAGWTVHRIILSANNTPEDLSLLLSGSPSDSNSSIEEIKISPTYLNDGEVRVSFRHTRKIEFIGDALSDSILPLIIRMLKNPEQDYASRSKIVDIISPYVENMKIQELLTEIMKSDDNSALRLKAMSALSEVANLRDVKAAIKDRLIHDKEDALRFKALEILDGFPDQETLSMLDSVSANDPSLIVRKRAAEIIINHQETDK